MGMCGTQRRAADSARIAALGVGMIADDAWLALRRLADGEPSSSDDADRAIAAGAKLLRDAAAVYDWPPTRRMHPHTAQLIAKAAQAPAEDPRPTLTELADLLINDPSTRLHMLCEIFDRLSRACLAAAAPRGCGQTRGRARVAAHI